MLSFRLANRNQTDNICFRKKTFFSEKKHFFSEKKHFCSEKTHFFPEKNIFSDKKHFFPKKQHFFPKKKHFFPASESDCPIHLISFRFGHFGPGPTETDITVLSFRLANRGRALVLTTPLELGLGSRPIFPLMHQYCDHALLTLVPVGLWEHLSCRVAQKLSD